MNDEDVLSTVEQFTDEGVRADLRVQTDPDTGRVRGRSCYYDDDTRLIMVHYEVVDAEEIPEDADLSDRRRGYDRYLREEEFYHRVEELREDPMIGESRGWFADESSDPATVYMPVQNGEVVREAGDLPVPSFLLYSHYNFREGVFEDGGLWDEIMNDEGDEEAVEA